MFKKILPFFVIISTLSIYSQNTVGVISATTDVYDGYMLYSDHKSTFLLNNCGQKLNEWTSEFTTGHAVYLLPNGNLLRAGRQEGKSNIGFGGVGGIVEIFDWDNNLLWQYEYNSNEQRQHHDVFPMPNGNVLILAATRKTNAEALQAGRLASLTSTDVYNERIIEVQPVGANQGNIVWEWNVFDHLIQDFDSNKDNFGVIKDNPQKLDINFLNGGNGEENWLHVNSIQYYEKLNQIVVSSRNLSEIWVIDHSTTTAEAATGSGGTYGKGGDFLYRWGNPQTYKHGNEADRKLFGQHYPHFIAEGLPDAGKIIVFNNGNGRDPDFSEVYKFAPPLKSDGTYEYTDDIAFTPQAPEFIYSNQSTSPSPFYSAILSGAQQLPNGNVLICQGKQGNIFEIDSNNNIVWQYINPIKGDGTIHTQHVVADNLDNQIFRALKYPKDYSAFNGRTLTPGNPIEINPDLSPCSILANENITFIENIKFANPTNGKIDFNIELDKVAVYSILGKKLVEFSKSENIDFSNLKPGLYLLKLTKGNKNTVKKIIKK